MARRGGASVKGKLITLEGPEGSGKSTHCRLLYDYLRKKGYKVFFAREPGGTKIGEAIRCILLDPKNKGMDVATEVFLYMAARRQLILDKILPELKRGHLVLLDRFLDATVCYQGYGGGYNIKEIKRLGRMLSEGIRPALKIVLDISPKEGLAKCRHKDRMESKNFAFHRRVRRGYLQAAKESRRRVRIVPVEREVSSTQRKIREIVMRRLQRYA